MNMEPDSSVEPASATTAPASFARRGGLDARRGTRRGRGFRVGANLRGALEALWANRLRSLLTALGVIVGVAAVIGAVTLTAGTSALINQRVSGLGTNTLTIIPGTTQTSGARGAAGTTQSLTEGDATAIAAVPHVANVSPVLGGSVQLVYGDTNWNTRTLGVYPSFQSIGNWQLAEGGWFTQSDEADAANVAVIGDTTETNLFADSAADPIGETMLINSQAFRIVGVLQAKGTTAGQNQDDVVYIPFSTAQARLNNSQYVSQIQVQVDSAPSVNGAQAAITTLLEQRHQVAAGQDDFTVRNAAQLVATAQTFAQTLTFLLVGIAAISLIVGGIGIMNIMLVSVTERTREIGIRVAIGARRSDIRNQFLIEALTLSGVGGVLGIALGLTLGSTLSVAFGLPLAFSIVPVVLAFVVSAGIGIVFGLYPAVRASRLDPIEALRTE